MVSTLQEVLCSSGQSHLWDHYQITLNGDRAAQDKFEQSVMKCNEMIDFKLYSSIFTESMNLFNGTQCDDIEPPTQDDIINGNDLPESLVNIGLEMVAAGDVAVLVLAGGSGTRLGHTYPKGMLVCPNLIAKKSLFQLQCERIRSLERLARTKTGEYSSPGKIQLIYMTSEQTDIVTREYFAENNYFGLAKDQVYFFMQSSLPCCNEMGKIILSSSTSIAVAPGGNAGVYSGVVKSGVLEEVAKKGVKYVQIYTVDNILAKIGDPAFSGFAKQNGCDVVVKVSPKKYDNEAVGVFAKRISGNDAKWSVVEYTEIGKERAKVRDPVTGERLFNAGNIAIHLCSVEFLRKAGAMMESYTSYHIAKKPIPTTPSPQNTCSSVPGVKLEAFIFDLFEFSKKFQMISVNRDDEFSPVKNADDVSHSSTDSPFTAAQALHHLHKRWVMTAAAKIRSDIVNSDDSNVHRNRDISTIDTLNALLYCDAKPTDDSGGTVVEISPLVSYSGEGITMEHLLSIVQQLTSEASAENGSPRRVAVIS
eukprot:Tbor_TRINITY_DN9966_c0_g1::TRINITY_DN9966_c0_g1_i1::g.17645::m.17645/K00972/UAP1; UDP-N-acetylglucosamine/UDP-N-acetylgalactosamine diphosphorylase